MARLRYNGLTATLGAALTSGDMTITFAAALAHSGGTAVPTLAASDYIPLTVLTSAGAVSEIVYLTAYTSGATTGTISRAKESTSATAHATGDQVVHSATVYDIGFSGAKLTKSATQSIASLTEVAVTFDGELIDTDGYHSTVTNTTRITAPADGIYLIGASLRIDSLAADKRVTAFLNKNGVFFPEGGYTRMTNAIAGESVSMPLTAMASLSAGDYIELGAYHTDTTARSVAASSGGTTFWIKRLT